MTTPITPEFIAERIQETYPDARVSARDMTGTADHWEVEVVSSAFEGKLPIERHRMIYGCFEEELKGPIHALTLKTQTPQQAEQA